MLNIIKIQNSLSFVGREIIQLVQDIGDVSLKIAFTPYGRLRINNIPKQTYYSTVRRFAKKGYLKKHKVNNNVRYSFTNLGRRLFSKKSYPSMPQVLRKDGNLTIIIFDIPENQKKQRIAFRRFLIKNNYQLLQKSVFCSKYILHRSTEVKIKELNLEDYVKTIVGKIEK